MPTSVHEDTEFVRGSTLLDLPHRASVSHHARFESGHGRTVSLCSGEHNNFQLRAKLSQ